MNRVFEFSTHIDRRATTYPKLKTNTSYDRTAVQTAKEDQRHLRVYFGYQELQPVRQLKLIKICLYRIKRKIHLSVDFFGTNTEIESSSGSKSNQSQQAPSRILTPEERKQADEFEDRLRRLPESQREAFFLELQVSVVSPEWNS